VERPELGDLAYEPLTAEVSRDADQGRAQGDHARGTRFEPPQVRRPISRDGSRTSSLST
jgi:hypothetical protein